jgi:hypothetical protein
VLPVAAKIRSSDVFTADVFDIHSRAKIYSFGFSGGVLIKSDKTPLEFAWEFAGKMCGNSIFVKLGK